ncbi:hypothetical protein Bca101_088749 [Brassica carinata]
MASAFKAGTRVLNSGKVLSQMESKEVSAESVQSVFIQEGSTGYSIGFNETRASGTTLKKTYKRRRSGTFTRKANGKGIAKGSTKPGKKVGEWMITETKRKAGDDVEPSQSSASRVQNCVKREPNSRHESGEKAKNNQRAQRPLQPAARDHCKLDMLRAMSRARSQWSLQRPLPCRAVSQTRNQRSCPSPLNSERCLWTAVTSRCRLLVELDFLFFAMAKPSQSSKHHRVLLDPATAR